jgi:SpoVK/Ycf46/Vps4 family AAA+-type ATPase
VIVLGGGTGKTLAAAALADAAGVALYRVDVGRVVSRYIGETEKNLDRVFRDVATFRAVLLFDEADALFGKRTDVEDASDRYANLETGYLLERIAAHPGIVILASNMRTAEMEPLIRRARCLLDSGGR